MGHAPTLILILLSQSWWLCGCLGDKDVLETHRNLLIVGTLDGSFHAIDSANGHTAWSFSTGSPLVTSSQSPSLKASERLLPSSEGDLFLTDPNTHSLIKLSYSVQDLVSMTPTSIKELPGVLLIGSQGTKLYRVNAKTGDFHCEAMETDTCPNSNVYESTAFILGRVEYGLSGVSFSTGEVLWNLTVSHFTSFQTEKQTSPKDLDRIEVNETQVALGPPGSRWTSEFEEPILALYTLETGKIVANPTSGIVRKPSIPMVDSSFTKFGNVYLPKTQADQILGPHAIYETLIEEQNINSQLLLLLWKTLLRFISFNKTLFLLIFSAISVGFLLGKIYERRAKRSVFVAAGNPDSQLIGSEMLPMLSLQHESAEIEGEISVEDLPDSRSPTFIQFMKNEQVAISKSASNSLSDKIAEGLFKEAVEVAELKGLEKETHVTAEISFKTEEGKMLKTEKRTHVSTYSTDSPGVAQFYQKAAEAGRTMVEMYGKDADGERYLIIPPSSIPKEPICIHPTTSSLEQSSRFKSSFENPVLIGKGGFGAVYKAKHKLDGREYAIKRIKFQAENLLTIQQHKFMREVHSMTELNSKYVVKYVTCWIEECPPVVPESPRTILEVDTLKSEESDDISLHFLPEEEGESVKLESDLESSSFNIKRTNENLANFLLYIQMEYCEGTTLKDYLTREDREIDSVFIFKLFNSLLKGVEHIHKKGVIHRDLKPANIFLCKENTPKIGDFGLAISGTRTVPGSTTKMKNVPSDICLSKAGVLSVNVGTPFYLAPEQENSANYDYKVDMYPLGLILLELTYKFSTDHERFHALKQIRQEHTLLSDLELHHPHESRLILWLTHPNSQLRPSARDVRDSEEMKAWQASLPQDKA